jgi:hypothetical protein
MVVRNADTFVRECAFQPFVGHHKVLRSCVIACGGTLSVYYVLKYHGPQ